MPFPWTIPPNTIAGRLGGSQPGPAQSIPIETFGPTVALSLGPAILCDASYASTSPLQLDGAIGALNVYTSFDNWHAVFLEAGGGAALAYGSTRGANPSTHVALQSGDSIVSNWVYGSDGTQYILSALWEVKVDGTVSAGKVPSRFAILTQNASGDVVEGLRVDSSQTVALGNVTTVSGLPAAGVEGRRTFVSDANSTTFASIVAGSGSNKVPVYDDGTHWRIG